MPKEVEACVRSIQDDNPDMDEETAYGICQDMENRGVLTAYNAADPDANDTKALAAFREPGDIERIEEGGEQVRYKHVMLLSPGLWADAGSQQTVDYNADAIRRSADNWINLESLIERTPNWRNLTNDERATRLRELGDEIATDAGDVNFLHGPSLFGADSLDSVGEIPRNSIIVDDDGRLFGDIVLHGDSPQSKTTIALMDEVLEAAEEPGVEPPPVGPSVEIPADRIDDSDGSKRLEEAWFSGVGIVFNPASRPVELGAQAQERAIAMTATDGDSPSMVFRHDAPERSALERVRALKARIERLRQLQ